eukprot:4330083-Prorocentrum_lima.AAC.1
MVVTSKKRRGLPRHDKACRCQTSLSYKEVIMLSWGMWRRFGALETPVRLSGSRPIRPDQ